MESKSLKAFVVVAEELNFRKAADRLGMSQPPLTRLINQLEYDLGARLFNRTTRMVELTGAGLHLLKKGKDILSELQNLEFEVRSIQKLRTGKLRISMSGSTFHSEVPKLISSFKDQFPKVTIELFDQSLNTIRQNLLTAKVDISFGPHDFKDHNLKKVPVQTHELGLAIPMNNILSDRKVIRLKDLEGETIIFHGKHEQLGFQSEFLQYLNHQGIYPKIYYKKSKESCGGLVEDGMGVLITSKGLMHESSQVRYVPFEDYSKKLKTFASWSTLNPSTPLKAFINFLEERTSVPTSELDGHFA